jgi:hypothetical protein
MNNSLQTKLAQVEDEHYQEAETQHVQKHGAERAAQAYMFLGGAMAIDRLQSHLASQVIAAMMTIEDQKLYQDFGYQTFADFLSKSELSPYSKTQFYKLRELYLTEGPENYDLFTNWKLPLTTRRLLAEKGVEIEVQGDEVIIGGEERVSVSESRTIKAIIEKLVKEKVDLSDDLAKLEAKTEKQKDTIDRGRQELEEAQRQIDQINENSPFERALMGFVKASLTLVGEVKALPEDERAERAEGDLQTFAEQWFQLRDAYGAKHSLSARAEVPGETPVLGTIMEGLMDRAIAATAGDEE